MFSLFNFSSSFPGGSQLSDPVCPYVRTPMLLVYQSSYQSSHRLLYEIKTILSYRSHTGNESVSGGVETKLKVGAQLQTFSYPTVSKSPPTFKFQCRLGEVVGKNIAFQERDGQTDTHTQTKKLDIFRPSSACEARAQQNCTVTEDVLVGPYLKNVFGSDVQFRQQRALKIWR